MPTVRDLVRIAVRAAQDRKAQQVETLDLRNLSSVTDYFVVCSGTSDTQVRGIADHVEEKLKELGQRPFSREGYREGTWVLLDYVDFVVHVFHQEQRARYGIEELWADARKVIVRPGPAKSPAAKKAAAGKKPAAARKPAARKAPAKRAAATKPKATPKPKAKR